MKGLGSVSEAWLNEIGIYTHADLESVGPVQAFIRLTNTRDIPVSLNLLYAMVGALENVHWADIAKTEKTRLLFELDGYSELDDIMRSDE